MTVVGLGIASSNKGAYYSLKFPIKIQCLILMEVKKWDFRVKSKML
jgi:hypothetical protein